ncbi:MAG TPA: DUF5681 domain-containing protein [Blastocatellia bacterium]
MNNENLEKGAPHRFKPGQSGNPGGRPKKRPISDCYAAIAEVKVPDIDRIKFGLPEGITYGHMLAIAVFNAALAGKLNAAREIREAIEGKTGQRQETSDPQELHFIIDDVGKQNSAAMTDAP